MKMKLFLVALVLVGVAFSQNELEATLAKVDYELEDIEVVLSTTNVVQCYLRMNGKPDVDSLCLEHTEERYRRVAELLKTVVLKVTVRKRCTPTRFWREKSCKRYIITNLENTFSLHISTKKEKRIFKLITNQFLTYLEEVNETKETDDRLDVVQQINTEDELKPQIAPPSNNRNQIKPFVPSAPSNRDSENSLRKIIDQQRKDIDGLKKQIEYLKSIVYDSYDDAKPKSQAPPLQIKPFNMDNLDLTNKIDDFKNMLGSPSSGSAPNTGFDWSDKKPVKRFGSAPQDDEDDFANNSFFGKGLNRIQPDKLAKENEDRLQNLKAISDKPINDPFDLAGDQNLEGLGLAGPSPAAILAQFDQNKPSAKNGAFRDGMVVPISSLKGLPMINGRPANSLGNQRDFDDANFAAPGTGFEDFEMLEKVKKVKKTE